MKEVEKRNIANRGPPTGYAFLAMAESYYNCGVKEPEE